tara:strand:- start:36 stop:515 length:480 start_codon:yes stop_codon:yes gene_type:complete
MAVTLRSYLNSQLKAMGKTSKQAQKDAGKYKSIAAAKKAGSLYYTDKNGKVMAAVYAEDLKKPLPLPKPKKRPEVKSRPLSPHSVGGGRGDGTKETLRRKLDPKSPQNKPNQGMSTKALREKARKLRTQIANARSKGKDNKAAVAEEKRINNMIRQRTR